MISRSPSMLVCVRVVNCCVSRCLASQSEATLERRRPFSQACLVCPDRDAKKGQSCEFRTIVTGEATPQEELATHESQIDDSSVAGKGDLLQKYEEKLMIDQLCHNDEVKDYPQAEGSPSVKGLRAGDTSAASITYQSRKSYHVIRRRTSRRFSEEKDTANLTPETTDDYDKCISLAVDDIIAGGPVAEAGWFHESWISDDGESRPLAGDSSAEQSIPDKAVYEQCISQTAKESREAIINTEATSHRPEDANTGLEVRYNSESYDLADFAEFLESIQETKSIAASEIEALFKDYVNSSKSQLEGDRTVYDECMNQAAERAKIDNVELGASTFSSDMSDYKEYMGEAADPPKFTVQTQWINEKGLPVDSRDEPVVLLSHEPTNMSASEKCGNQLYLDEIQSMWHRGHAATKSTSESTDVFNADQDIIDMALDVSMSDREKNTETANKIFFDEMQSVWDPNLADLITEYDPQADDETDFTEFLRRESEAPEAKDIIQSYRPFKTIQVPTDMKITRSKVSTGPDDSLKSQRPAVPIATGKWGKGIPKRPTDKSPVSQGDAKGRPIHTKLTEKQSHKLVVLALQHALDELKSGKANLKTQITFTKP